MSTYWVASAVEFNEGGSPLGVFSSVDLARGFCEDDAKAKGVTLIWGKIVHDAVTGMPSSGGVYWEVEGFTLDAGQEQA